QLERDRYKARIQRDGHESFSLIWWHIAAAILTAAAGGGKGGLRRARPRRYRGGFGMARSVGNRLANPIFGQVKIDHCPLAGFAGDFDRALVQLDQSLGERQPEADTVILSVQAAIDL